MHVASCLGSEGNALYPVLSSLYYTSYNTTDGTLHSVVSAKSLTHRSAGGADDGSLL